MVRIGVFRGILASLMAFGFVTTELACSTARAQSSVFQSYFVGENTGAVQWVSHCDCCDECVPCPSGLPDSMAYPDDSGEYVPGVPDIAEQGRTTDSGALGVDSPLQGADPLAGMARLGPGASLARSAPAVSNTDRGAYIGDAIVRNQMVFRFDAAFNNTTPDRAEFFYPQCGCFFPSTPGPGPAQPETSVDYQDVSAYLELAASDRVSGFVEIPVRFLNPEVNDNTAGLGDITAGFKYAALAYPNEYLTFQLKFYTPTGDGERGLGTDHVSIEPGVLYYSRCGRLTSYGEFSAWIPISNNTYNGIDFAGEVLRYGLGAGYDIYERRTCSCVERLTPILEVVGWSVVDGLVFDGNRGVVEEADTTIVNLKFGARYSRNQGSVYLGYGRALTGTTWYEDIVRLELQRSF